MTVDLPVGPNDVMEYCKVVEGYTFKSVSSQTVEVSADGVATPAKVTFTYHRESHHRDRSGPLPQQHRRRPARPRR